MQAPLPDPPPLFNNYLDQYVFQEDIQVDVDNFSTVVQAYLSLGVTGKILRSSICLVPQGAYDGEMVGNNLPIETISFKYTLTALKKRIASFELIDYSPTSLTVTIFLVLHKRSNGLPPVLNDIFETYGNTRPTLNSFPSVSSGYEILAYNTHTLNQTVVYVPPPPPIYSMTVPFWEVNGAFVEGTGNVTGGQLPYSLEHDFPEDTTSGFIAMPRVISSEINYAGRTIVTKFKADRAFDPIVDDITENNIFLCALWAPYTDEGDLSFEVDGVANILFIQ